MPSPFPGMNPYLEGYVSADVHQALAYQCRRQYDETQYGLTLNYDGPLPPLSLSSQDMAWVESCVRSWRQEQ